MSSVSKIIVGTPIRRLQGSNSALGSLANVTITSVANGQIIVYNSATSEWENASLDSGEGLNLSWDSAANKWTLSAEFADSNNPGIAKFISSDFTVGDSGSVSIKFDALPESLVPATDSAYDLGSSSKKWRHLYLSGNSLFINGQTLSYDSIGGTLNFNGNSILVNGDSSADSDIRNLFSASGNLSYNPSTGVFSYSDSDRAASIIKGMFSADGGLLSYDSTSGQFSLNDSDIAQTNIRETFHAGIEMPDNVSIRFKNGEGYVYNYNDQMLITGGNADGAVKLYHGPSTERLATTTTGVTVNGNVIADSALIGTLQLDSSTIKNLFSATGSLSFDAGTGVFSYTDSDRSRAEVLGLFSASGGGLSYNSSTGAFTDSDRTEAQIKGMFSASGDLSYNSSTGQFSYTDSDRSASAIKGLFSGAGNITYNSSTGEFSYTDSDRSRGEIFGLFQVSDGTGGISYDPITGIFSDSSRSREQLLGLYSASGDTNVLSYDAGTGQFSTSLVDSDLAKTNANEVFHQGITIPDTKLINFADSTGSAVASLGHSSDVLNLSHDGRITFRSSENEVRLFAYDSVRIRATNIGASINGRVTADSAFVDGVQLSTTVGHAAYSEGLVWYDNIHKTVNFYGDDSNIIHEIGIEEHQRVYNNTGADIAAGKPLYFSGNYNPGGAEPVPTVGLADATDVNAYNAQGLAASIIADGTYGYMIRSGLVEGFDTSGLTAGQNVFVGLGPGLLQNASPTYPNYPMCIGWVVKSDATNGVISINQQNHSVNSFRVRTDAHIGNNLRVDGNLTVAGTQTITSTENISIGGAIQYLNAGNTIGEAGTSFVGTGLDDAFFAGHYSGDSSSKSFYVKIDATGTPDTFEWGFDSAVGAVATGVAIDGTAQMLDSAYNISIDFGATTGHTLNDKWTGTATAVNTDTGIFSNRNAGSNYTHVGMYFDVSTNKWTFLNAYDSEPGQIINPENGTYGALKAATYEGDLTGDVTGTVSDISNHTTTNLAEGTNQYFTEARARNALKVGGDLSYDSASGQLTYTDSDRSRAQVLELFSASGGGLSYNNSTGAFTDSDRTRAQILGMFTASGGGLSYNNTTGAFTDSDRSASSIKGLFSVSGEGLTYDSSSGAFALDDSDRSAASIKGLFSASGGGLSYNPSTGVFTDSDRSAAQIKGLFSASGGGLSYNNSTGAFTDSDRSAAQIKGLFSVSGEGFTYDSSSGAFALDDSDRTAAQIKGLFTADGKILGYNNTTGLFSVDSADISNIITADVDKAFVDALNVDADTLDGQQGTYYRINVYNAAGTLLN